MTTPYNPNSSKYAPGTPLTVGTHTAIVHRYLSSGGFAQVYKVEISPPWTPPNSSTPTSIACLKRVVVPDKQHLNTLRAEVDSMKRLAGKDPHIVSYIDSHAARLQEGQKGYEVFVLMELCEKKGLIDFMNTRLTNRLTESEVLRIMGEVTQGITVMHALDPVLIHRDIKIENVLISADGKYKVCDFGSASPVLRPPRNPDEVAVLTHDLMSNTTPQYRAPEMLDLSKGYPVNEKADIWALGVFLYKLCYYTTPFEQGGDSQILQGRYTTPDRPHYSDRLKNLIGVLLRSDPRRRPNAFQVLEEVCKMRGVPLPFEDPNKKKKLAEQQQQQQQQQQQKQKLQVPQQQIYNNGKELPNFNSAANLSSLNNFKSPPPPPLPSVPIQQVASFTNNQLKPPGPPSTSRPLSTSPQRDPFRDLKQFPGQAQTQTQQIPPLKPPRPQSLYSLQSNFNNLSLNNQAPPMPLANQYQPITQPARPKYVDSVTQTDDVQEEITIPSRPARHQRRPLSMHVTPKSSDSINSTTELKQLVSNSISQPQEHQFVESQNSGKSWNPQPQSRMGTGGSFKSLRRISTGAGKLIDNLTGRLSRSHSRSSSISSLGEFNNNGNNGGAGLANQMRKSSEGYDTAPPAKEPTSASVKETISTHASSNVNSNSSGNCNEIPRSNSIKRSGSIQKRISAFLNRASREDDGIPIVKTAQGYGNDVEEAKGTDEDGFKKPSLPQPFRSTSGSSSHPGKAPQLRSTSQCSTSSTIVGTSSPTPVPPNPITKQPKGSALPPPVKPKKPDHLKGKPPVKPAKPSYLKSASSGTVTANGEKMKRKKKKVPPVIPDRPKGNFSALKGYETPPKALRKKMDGEDIFATDESEEVENSDLDDYEREFHDKFPPPIL